MTTTDPGALPEAIPGADEHPKGCSVNSTAPGLVPSFTGNFVKDHKSRSRPGVAVGGAETPQWKAFIRWEANTRAWTVGSLKEAMDRAKNKSNAKVDWGTPHGNEHHRPAGTNKAVRPRKAAPNNRAVKGSGALPEPSCGPAIPRQAGDDNLLAQAIPTGVEGGAGVESERDRGIVVPAGRCAAPAEVALVAAGLSPGPGVAESNDGDGVNTEAASA